MMRCLIILTLALGVYASGGAGPVWMPAKLMKARDSAAAATSRHGFKPYQRNPRPENPGIFHGLKLIPSRVVLGSKEFATELASTVQAKASRSQESIAESLRAKRVWEDSCKVAVLVALRTTALNFAIYFPSAFFPSTMLGELGHMDEVAKRHRKRVKCSALLMTRLTEGEGVPEATLNEEAPFLMAIDSVLAASTVEAAFAAVEAVAASAAAAATAAEQTPVASASNKAASDATATAPADEAKTRSSMASLFATVAAWPAKPISAADSTPISSAAAANSAATAAAAAEAKAAAEVKKSPLKGVPGPLVKGLGRSCLDVPFGLAWWGPAFCVRPIVKGQLRELVKADAKLLECGGAASLDALSRRDLQDLCLKRGIGDPAATDDELRAGLAAWLAVVEPTPAAAAEGAAGGASNRGAGAGAKGFGGNSKAGKEVLESSSASTSFLADPIRKRAMLLSWNAVQACRTQDLAAPHRALFTPPSSRLTRSDAQKGSLASQAAFLTLTVVPAAAAGVLVGSALSTGRISFSGSSGSSSSNQQPKAALEVPSVVAGQAVGANLVDDSTTP